MQIVTELITPEIAGRYLKQNTANRPCTQNRITHFARAMERGEWKKNGDAIRFAADGTLLDGQGRLRACILSGVPFETLVIRGLPPDVFSTIDIGKKRSASDFLAIRGEKNTNALTTGVRFLYSYNGGRWSDQKQTPAQILSMLDENPGLRDWIYFTSQLRRVTRNASIVATVCYIASLTRPSTASSFLELFLNGAGLDERSPILALRDRMQQDRGSARKMHDSYSAQLIIHAYNAYALGNERLILRGNVNSRDLPRIVK